VIVVSTEQFSLDHANRSEIAQFLGDVIEGRQSALLKLQINKGDDEFGAISLLLSNASAAAHQVFSRALGDVFFQCAEDVSEDDEGNRRLLRALQLLEITLADRLSIETIGFLGTLKSLTERNDKSIVLASARVLSYFGSDPVAVRILQNLHERTGNDATFAAYFLAARTDADPQTALEIQFGNLDPEAFRSNAALALSIQDAVWRMFRQDGRFARMKLKAQAAKWPRALSKMVLDVLASPPLIETDMAAKQAASELSQLLGPQPSPVVEFSSATGVAARVIKRKQLVCMEGYSMRAASGPGEFESHWDLWMTKLAETVCTILSERYRDAQDLEWAHRSWWKGAKWTEVIESVTLLDFMTRPDEANDVCFEMFYIDRERRAKYGLVSFASLKTFSVLYHKNNAVVREVLEIDGLKSRKTPTQFFSYSSPDIATFLRRVQRAQNSPQVIFIPVFDLAGEVINKLIKDRVWETDHRRRVDGAHELLEELDRHQLDAIVVCDNVTANDLWKRSQSRRVYLESVRFSYPEASPVGLVFDDLDQEWGDILHEAFERLVADSDPAVQASLREHITRLIAMDAEPSDVLKRVLQSAAKDAAGALPSTKAKHE
jgi:hypothetical protein